MRTSLSSRTTRGVLYATAGVAVIATGAAASASSYGYSGHAYGSKATAGHTAVSGKTASVPLGCTTDAGLTKSNSTSATTVPGFGSVGAVTTRAESRHPAAGTIESLSRSQVNGTSLLGGAITASAITSTATATHAARGFSTAGDTTIAGLRIDGHSVSASPKPNQRYSLPGVGTLVLNEQKTSGVTGGGKALTVNALHLVTSKHNSLNLPSGSSLIVGHSQAAVRSPNAGLVHGLGWGSQLTVGSTERSGPSTPTHLGCLGTDGATTRNTTGDSSDNGALTTGNVTTTASGVVTKATSSATTTARVDGSKLLGSVVHAKVIKAVAHAAVGKDGSLSRSTRGSGFAGLTVQGNHQSKNVKPNTKLTLPGVGTLWLRRVIDSKHGVEVHMVELITSVAKDGLPKGADLIVGAAKVSARH